MFEVPFVSHRNKKEKRKRGISLRVKEEHVPSAQRVGQNTRGRRAQTTKNNNNNEHAIGRDRG